MNALAGLAQALAAVFWLITAIYALLASQTFAYEQFLRPGLVPALTWFAAWHQVLAPVTLALFVGLHVLSGTCRRRGSAVALGVLGVVWTLASVGLAVLPPLATLGPGTIADAAIFVALVPLLLAAAIDLTSAPVIDGTTPGDRQVGDFVACLLAACLAAGVSVMIGLATGASLNADTAPALVSSTLLHGLTFLAVFLCVTCVRSIGALTRSRRVECAGAFVLLSVGIFLFLWRTVFPTVVADALWQIALALAFALAVSAVVTARGLRVSSETDDGVVRLVAALSPRLAGGPIGFVAWIAVIGVAAWIGARASRTADWNFVLADLAVATTWLLLLAAALRLVRVETSGRSLVVFSLTAAALAANAGWTSTMAAKAGHAGHKTWLAHDPAFRLLADAVTRETVSADEGLVELLQVHTNVPASVTVSPVDITLAETTPAAAYRPHVFLFVIDSLRRDYVGAYNPAVTFTPALDALARDGVAFSQAFTRYGATGLAVPSIWTGSMLLHKQYVRPFAPMNALAKLLHGQGYAQWISMDHIMETILPTAERRIPLDADRTVKDFRFCDTVAEVRGRLAARAPDAGPVFVYTLPQDIHVSAVAREGSSVPRVAVFDGFNAPVASRIERLDGCFAAFVADLRALGVYDDSVIIVTSDHGDSLGEDGRVGHAYTLYPEIVRIPLIVRLPPRLAGALEAENQGPVFSTDITPTLYALLGKAPAQPRPFFGRPLFRARGASPRGSQGNVPVVAASYGAVYGALLDEGSTLYVMDTINFREHLFALERNGAAREATASTEQRRAGQLAIRETVRDIAGYFGYRPGP